MIAQRFGQVWLYHGGAPLPELLRPHGFREAAALLENLEHDDLQRGDSEEEPIEL